MVQTTQPLSRKVRRSPRIQRFATAIAASFASPPQTPTRILFENSSSAQQNPRVTSDAQPLSNRDLCPQSLSAFPTAPSQTITPPSQFPTAPSQPTTAPSQFPTAPSQPTTAPSQPTTAPSQSPVAPFQTASPPSQYPTAPSQIATPPSQYPTAPSQIATPPSQYPTAPSQSAAPLLEIPTASSPAPPASSQITPAQNLPSAVPQNVIQEPGQSNDSASLIDDGHVDELTVVYTYLSSLKKLELRDIGKVWKCRSQGNKPELIYRNFLFLKKVKETGGDVRSKIAENPSCPSFEEFLKKHEQSSADWVAPLPESDMKKALKNFGDKFDTPQEAGPSQVRNNTLETTNNDPHFSLSEFGRLLIIMRDDEEAREAMVRLTQELGRSELDAGVSRDSFWGVIADRFNDSSVPVNFSFTGDVEEAVPSNPPLCRRPASVLKTHFQESRSSFTVALDRWSRSGQNDPARFINFLSKNGLDLYATSKRSLMMFVVCQLGTPHADSLFTDMCTKTISSRGVEVGMPGISGVTEGEDSRAGRKRRRESEGISADVRGMEKSFEMIVSKLSGKDETDVSPNTKKRNATAHSWQNEKVLFDTVTDAYECWEKAKKGNNSAYLELTKWRFEQVTSDYKQLYKPN